MTFKRAIFFLLFLAIIVLVFIQVPKTSSYSTPLVSPSLVLATPFPTPEPTPSASPSATPRPLSLYPDRSLTPGVTADVNIDLLCLPSYVKSIRDVSETVKKQVFKEYRLDYPPAKNTYEIDRFIPLELGGTNSIKNLWPEPAAPTPGYHEKDTVEIYLRTQVCSGALSLGTAQSKIKTDWYAVYRQLHPSTQ